MAHTDAAACQRLVHETLDPSKVVLVVVGNAAKIQKDLEAIAPVTVLKADTGEKSH
jgi:hypothetical protein